MTPAGNTGGSLNRGLPHVVVLFWALTAFRHDPNLMAASQKTYHCYRWALGLDGTPLRVGL